jgi:serine phosphatase RsbU (regulator of sigma subunit)
MAPPAEVGSMAAIEVRTNAGLLGRFPVKHGRIVIGRSEESDVFLADYLLSRRHAEIEERNDGCYLVDLGSTNGTYLNGERIEGERRLQDGDLIAVGESRMIFSSGDGGIEDADDANRIAWREAAVREGVGREVALRAELGSEGRGQGGNGHQNGASAGGGIGAAMNAGAGPSAADDAYASLEAQVVDRIDDRTDENTVLVDAQSYTIRDLQARTTNRAVNVVDLTQKNRVYQLLSRATSLLLGHRPLPDLFERVLDVIFEAIPAERACVVLFDPRRGRHELKATRSRVGPTITRVSNAIARRVVERRVALLIANVLEDAVLRRRESIMAPGIRSAICAPLWWVPRVGAAEEVIGLIYADTVGLPGAFGEDDLEILTAFANVAASKIESTRLFEERVEKERLENEIRTAAEIQQSVLAQAVPEVPGCELAGASRPCEAVGGDFHDLAWEGGELRMALADVSGKGLGAAMLMSGLRSAVHAHWRDAALGMSATRINRTFFENIPLDRYATCFLGRYDPESGRLAYVNAGHPPPLLVRAQSPVVERLVRGGAGLGLFETAPFDEGFTTMTPGDTLLVYSDGVSESWPSVDEAEAVLIQLVRRFHSEPVVDLQREILAAVDRQRGSSPSDDCTLVVLRKSGTPEEPPPP